MFEFFELEVKVQGIRSSITYPSNINGFCNLLLNDHQQDTDHSTSLRTFASSEGVIYSRYFVIVDGGRRRSAFSGDRQKLFEPEGAQRTCPTFSSKMSLGSSSTSSSAIHVKPTGIGAATFPTYAADLLALKLI